MSLRACMRGRAQHTIQHRDFASSFMRVPVGSCLEGIGDEGTLQQEAENRHGHEGRRQHAAG